jgi:hypothetical protein
MTVVVGEAVLCHSNRENRLRNSGELAGELESPTKPDHLTSTGNMFIPSSLNLFSMMC